MRALQLFSDEYLARCRELSPDQIVRFLDDFRRIHGRRQREAAETADDTPRIFDSPSE